MIDSRPLFSPTGLFTLGALLAGCLVIWVKTELNGRIDMARTHANFSEAVKVARSSIADDAIAHAGKTVFTAEGIPTVSDIPGNTGEWISKFSQQAMLAPAGGPAYTVNTSGNNRTGAIGVSATSYGREIRISRPAFLGLNAQKVVITNNGISYQPPLK